ncbi:MAG: DUF2490 domain-containing protein [Fluviicola sp.]|nr:DUF2490 domain-containing protein [Fluviicola sp.]
MRWFLLIMFLEMSPVFTAQKAFQQNLWGSLVWNHQWNEKIETVTDVGYRQCDQFFHKRRQVLSRLTALYRFENGFSAGIGFAWFQHSSLTSNATTNEYRPFLQMGYRWGKGAWNSQLRSRQEWRLYPSTDKQFHRARLQIQLRRKTRFSWLQPAVSIEGFSTLQRNGLLESRMTIGNNFTLKRQSLFLFFTLQNQTSVDENQHIIGLQLSLKTGKHVN